MTSHYYNEHDPKAAAWLRELMKAGEIPAGDVDERDIREVKADDVKHYTQAHFFAGIGGWPLALRLAGWDAGRRIFTGSCPCPPFSAAGKKKRCPECGGARPVPCPCRTGFFICTVCEHAWHADERHLWPEFRRIIRDSGIPVVAGEQVAGADGRIWLAGVRATLERDGYTVGAADLAAAGVGTPHIRQRLWWLAYSTSLGRDKGRRLVEERSGLSDRVGLVNPIGERCGETRSPVGSETGPANVPAGSVPVGRLGDPVFSRLEGHAGHVDGGREPGRHVAKSDGSTAATGAVGGMGFAEGGRDRSVPFPGINCESTDARWERGAGGPSPSHFWSAFDLIPCRDGKARRVEPGTFPLAHGVPARVGRLRGYGNAIVPQVAAEFIRAYLEAEQELAG